MASFPAQPPPCSQPGWYPVQIRLKGFFSRCWVSCVTVLRPSYAVGDPASEDTLCGWVRD